MLSRRFSWSRCHDCTSLWPPSTAAAFNSLAGEDVALSVSCRTISFGTLHGRTVLMPESRESPSLSAVYGRYHKVGAWNKDDLCVGSLYVTSIYLNQARGYSCSNFPPYCNLSRNSILRQIGVSFFAIWTRKRFCACMTVLTKKALKTSLLSYYSMPIP